VLSRRVRVVTLGGGFAGIQPPRNVLTAADVAA
jgi:hypothetical protein